MPVLCHENMCHVFKACGDLAFASHVFAFIKIFIHSFFIVSYTGTKLLEIKFYWFNVNFLS